jgi:acyl-CoA synthetase (AMP-forming)/AMP-acid ligase II
VKAGQRLVLLVPPGIDFICLTFALFKTGAVVVLIDPGMGRDHLLQCLQDVDPDGFIAVPLAQAARLLHRRRFPQARCNVTVGRRWGWGGPTLEHLRQYAPQDHRRPDIGARDPAAIIFTTGSTGPPKGVLYSHGSFASQVQQLRDFYQVRPGEVDLPAFPLFALFNSAMGVTSVIPDMDPRKPAAVDPARIVEAVRDWNVTQAFGSPALWNVVGPYCVRQQIQLPSLQRVLSAGAPVPPRVLGQMKQVIAPAGDIHTPYGATEALPVASISASEVLDQTAQRSAQGAGTCVGRRFSGIRWQVIRIRDEPIPSVDQAEPLPVGEIGELIVQGPVVTREYVTRTDNNALAKIIDGQQIWHRMGDVGYLDEEDRFWFCGRKSHRVITREGTCFTVPCEAIFNQHPDIYRSALVGLGPIGEQLPTIVAEPLPGRFPTSSSHQQRLVAELFELGQASSLTRGIARQQILLHKTLPVDIRHNAKIFREQLVPWVAGRMKRRERAQGPVAGERTY